MRVPILLSVSDFETIVLTNNKQNGNMKVTIVKKEAILEENSS